MALDPDSVLLQVEAHLLSVLGQDSGRAGVSFLGAARIDVLRFGPDPDGPVRHATLGAPLGSVGAGRVEVLRCGPDPDGLVRDATLGMSRAPMGDPGSLVVLEDGPRAELVLSVTDLHGSVVRALPV